PDLLLTAAQIQTSLGDIDARVQTQLQAIEEKIRELVPIKG
ncbi:hypothetical protein LCGC14_3120800, partial [marine sediment metagenome]